MASLTGMTLVDVDVRVRYPSSGDRVDAVRRSAAHMLDAVATLGADGGMTIMIEETITVEDLIGLSEANPLLRFELSPEGTIEATMTPRSRHNALIMKLALWLAPHFPGADDRLQQDTGVEVHQDGLTGYRRPDLMLFAKEPPEDAVYLDPSLVVLVVEVVSRATKAIDFEKKVVEYAASGIPHYWIVDAKENVWLHRLDPQTRRYRPYDTSVIAFADLITRDPAPLLAGEPVINPGEPADEPLADEAVTEEPSA
jgi:Uma2 family endonuclease